LYHFAVLPWVFPTVLGIVVVAVVLRFAKSSLTTELYEPYTMSTQEALTNLSTMLSRRRSLVAGASFPGDFLMYPTILWPSFM
jgi:hypothetical protein